MNSQQPPEHPLAAALRQFGFVDLTERHSWRTWQSMQEPPIDHEVEIRLMLQPEPGWEYTTHRQMREHLYAQFLDAWDTLEKLGYRFSSHPRLDIRGDVNYRFNDPKPIYCTMAEAQFDVWVRHDGRDMIEPDTTDKAA